MKLSIRKFLVSHTPRERAVLTGVAVFLGVALYLSFLHWADRHRQRLHSSVAALRIQALHLDRHAAELAHLRAAPPTVASTTHLRTVMQDRAGAAGLAPALTRTDAPDAHHATLVFGAVPFQDWLAWVASLQSQKIRVVTCRIEALSTAGLVSVTATFTRSASN